MPHPAVEAAQRASREDPGWPKRVIAEEAAREALKPIRAEMVRLSEFAAQATNADFANGISFAMKAIAPLIYTTEELDR